MSDEGRAEPGAGNRAENGWANSPWPPQPAPQQPAGEEPTERYPQWPTPGAAPYEPQGPAQPQPPQVPAQQQYPSHPQPQYPPQPQPQYPSQPQPQYPSQPQQQYPPQPQPQYPSQLQPQYPPQPQQYGPPPGQYGAGYGQVSGPPYGQTSAPPYGQTSAPPYGQPADPAQVSGVPGDSGQPSSSPWATGPATASSDAGPAVQPMPTPLPPQPAPGAWTAGQAAAGVPLLPPAATDNWPPNPAPPLPISVPPQPVPASWPSTDSPAQPTSTPPSPGPQQPRPGWAGPTRVEQVDDAGAAPWRVPPLGSVEKRPSGGRALLWTILVAVVVAVLAGGGGYFLGGGGKKQADAGPKPSASPSLDAFAQSQATLNRAKFDGDLLPIATPWLTDMGGCVSDTDTGGPPLQPDETKHVFCRHGGVSVHFAQYKSQTARDAARAYRVKLSYTSPGLAPGQGAPGPKAGGSGANGDYVEYALKEDDGRALCGIWWNRTDGSAALMMEALCEEVLGGDWQPFRDLWLRHS